MLTAIDALARLREGNRRFVADQPLGSAISGDARRAALIDADQSDPFTAWVFPIFILGKMLGTLLFAIGLLRSRTVPIWSAILIMLWPPLHVTGLIVGGEVLEVIGAVLQAIGFAGVAAVALRRSGQASVG